MTESTAARTLRRPDDRRVLGGVSAGLADYLRIDPVIVRIAFIVSLFIGGVGIVAYGAAWLLVPDEAGTAIVSSRRLGASQDLTRVVGIVLVFFAATLVLGQWSWTGEVLFPVLLIAAGVWLLLRRRDDEAPTVQPSDPSTMHDGPPETVGSPYATTIVAPPAPAPPTPPAPPASPARRERTGPPVTQITVALVFLAAGGFGLAAGAFPDLTIQFALTVCVAITGAGLVVGAFVGRGRLLIPLGIVLLGALSLSTAVDVDLRGGIGERRYMPATLAEIEDDYRLGVGEMVIDLRDLDPADLRGERVEIDASISLGSLEILVPRGVSVRGAARAQVGDIRVFDRTEEGTDPMITIEREGQEGAGVIVIDADVDAGEIEIR